MNINHILILTLLLTMFFFNLRRSSVVYLRPLFLPFGCIIFILFLMVFSNTAIESASSGLRLWLDIVFPSLFPFLVASEVLCQTGFVNAAGVLLEPIMRPVFNVPGCGSFALAMGLIGGCPIGAKITADLKRENLLTKIEAERLLTFTNNSGPLFIMGSIAAGMLGKPELGPFLLICHILSSLSVGLIFRFYGRNTDKIKSKEYKKTWPRFKKELQKVKKKNLNFGVALGSSVKNSVNTMLSIGGFIILFSVVINILIESGFISLTINTLTAFFPLSSPQKEVATGIASGFFEVTTGANILCKLGGATFLERLTSISLILGWSGLSIHSQVYSIISKTNVSIKPYIFAKTFQGILSAIYVFIFIRFLNIEYPVIKTIFLTPKTGLGFTWYNYFLFLLCYSLLLLIVAIVLYVIIFLVRTIGNRIGIKPLR